MINTMKTARVISLFVARLLLSLGFLVALLGQVTNWSETEHSLMEAICQWQSFAGFSDSIQNCLTTLVPWAAALLSLGVLLEGLGSLMLLFGFHERVGATLLILFSIPTLLLFHPFWFFEGPVRDLQFSLFVNQLAVIGGLIVVAVHGAHESKGDSASTGFS